MDGINLRHYLTALMDGIYGPLMPTYVGSFYIDTSEDSIGMQNINIEISFTHNNYRQTITPEYRIDKNVNALFCINRGELNSTAKKKRCVCNTDQQIPDASSHIIARKRNVIQC
jgi:hypothetical protein